MQKGFQYLEKQELISSKEHRVSTFLKHFKIISHFLLINQSFNESSVSRTAHPLLKIAIIYIP